MGRKNVKRIDELEEAAIDARRAHRNLIRERDEKERARVAEFSRQVGAELDAEYSDRIRELASASVAASHAETAERDRMAREEPESPLPVGTKVCEWKVRGWSRTLKPGEFKLTGRIGVIEIWTSESVYPANMRRYSLPSIGSWFIRLLDKKGKPSKLFIKRWVSEGDKLPREWAAEGERPKA